MDITADRAYNEIHEARPLERPYEELRNEAFS